MLSAWGNPDLWLSATILQVCSGHKSQSANEAPDFSMVQKTSGIPLVHPHQTGSILHETSYMSQPCLLLGIILICGCLPPSCRDIWCVLGTNPKSANEAPDFSMVQKISGIPLVHPHQTGSVLHETSCMSQPCLLLGMILICGCLPPSCRDVVVCSGHKSHINQ